jgi:transcriptional regulator with XRE-family HTH domain
MGLLLRQWRERRGLSLHALADKSGVHFVTIVKIEQGHMSPTVALLEKLAAGLGVTVRDLFPVERPKRRSSKQGGQS